ncbi:MAG: hypothetical protein IH845_04175 [Nanoarchaeota archaeon]|nr:hypothetical protein [Nanoarchaeota archaeon]
MKILLDTNFIIACVKENIYFDSLADKLFSEEIEWIIPQDVLNELGNIKDTHGIMVKDREAALLSFEILKHLKHTVVELPGKNPNVDIKIVNYLIDNPQVVLATMDKDLKSRVKNKILSVRGKGKLGIV